MRKLTILVSLLSVLLLVAACGVSEPVARGRQRTASATLAISPGGLKDGKVGQQYAFTLAAALIPQAVRIVTFEWTMGDGKTTGSQDVAVVDGTATTTITHAYGAKNVYGLTALVRAKDARVLATRTVTVGIEANPERELELATCDGWRSSTQGGYGVTVDIWDISSVPSGAQFDLQFDTYRIPDKIIVEYPDAVTVFNSGWRGDQRYAASDLYPGGLAGIGQGGVGAMFTKGADNSVKITVIGPDPSTQWKYEIRCSVGGGR